MASDLAIALEEAIENAVNDAIAEYGDKELGEKVNELVDDFLKNANFAEYDDFSDAVSSTVDREVEKAVECHVDNLDLKDVVEAAVRDADIESKVEAAVRDYDLSSHVSDAVAGFLASREGFAALTEAVEKVLDERRANSVLNRAKMFVRNLFKRKEVDNGTAEV